jgi:chromosome segregation ATPase
MERRIGLLEEQNRLLGEKLQASKVEDHRQQAEKQSISKEIEKLMDHMKRLENEVTDSAAKSERAIRSREDEIKTMAEVIQIKTNNQSSLEARTEKLLQEIDEIRLSTEKQTKKDMETLKNSLLESAKQELSEMKVVHKRQMDDITMKLKVKLEQENVLVKTTRAQSEQLKELKDQIIRLQQERTSPSDLSGGENGASPASNNKLDQMNVEEVMETIQNIDPLHNIVLASDDASEKSVDSSRNDIPRYETFSRGKHTLQYVVLLNIYIQTSCHCL